MPIIIPGISLLRIGVISYASMILGLCLEVETATAQEAGTSTAAKVVSTDLNNTRVPVRIGNIAFANVPADTDTDVFGASASDIRPLDSHAESISDDDPKSPFIREVSGHSDKLNIIVGQGRLITLRDQLSQDGTPAFVAAGDPSVIDFEVIGPRQIRVIGLSMGVTDLSITTSEDYTHSLEVHVVADLEVLEARLQASFPNAQVKLSHLRNHLVVEGQAQSVVQADRILQTIEAYLMAVHSSQLRQINYAGAPAETADDQRATNPATTTSQPPAGSIARPEQNLRPRGSSTVQAPQLINLLKIPGAQQVLLKVQIAELNRTALRQLGVSLASTGDNVSFGSNITGAAGAVNNGMLTFTNAATTIAGMHFAADQTLQYWVDALQANGVLKILAEPNLVAKNGHRASFLAGGEFPVPVPQINSSGSATTTVEYREFGVRLNFIPHILDDGVIELTVEPEVSSIDQSLATSLVANGSPVPGLNTRRANTTVDLREGETLTIAGLMQLEVNGSDRQIPGLGSLPVIGPFFSNRSSRRFEKELVVLVTPHLVESVRKEYLPPLPGSQVHEPNNAELYMMGRIESRVGRDFRSTTEWDSPLEILELERRHVQGTVGFSD